MIVKCNKADEDVIFSYIGDNYPSCLYLYLNLKKYGIESEKITVYIQEKNNCITSVLLKYYSCIHVFSTQNDFDAEELGHFIETGKFSMVYCTTKTADIVYLALHDKIRSKSTISNGWVARIDQVDKQPKGIAIKAAKGDFEQIVRLIYDDEDIGRSYKYDELEKQLIERNSSGYSRNLVIKDNDLVIAHACTNAEINKIAVVAELLVRSDYRRKGYASEIWRDLCCRLLSEGKEVYSFYYSSESRALHKKIGFYEICEWGKIVIGEN